MDKNSSSRREFVKKAVYVAPAVVTLAAAPAYAKKGSEKPKPKSKSKKSESESDGSE